MIEFDDNNLAMVYNLAKNCHISISPIHDAVLISGKKFDVERFIGRIANVLPDEWELVLEQK
jgi:hypothetical protein